MFYYDLSQLAADNILTQRANVLAIWLLGCKEVRILWLLFAVLP